MTATYTVDVTCSTHDALRHGIVELSRSPGADSWHRIEIDPADVHDDAEAVLIAAQMACATSGGMCTSAVLVSWPDEGSD